ncbi:MAG: glycosyltransferase [Planctomycetes bacterium]|nr:glycosyltransferase [Planctomycetota bacterium]
MDSQSLLICAYALTLGVLAVYGLHRLALLARFRWERETPLPESTARELPIVTVQLPIYNERNVAARLIRAALALDYPPERLEIQVLDDSSDDTCALVDEEVARGRARGIDIQAVRRSDRKGFKAGALDHGQRLAKGELFCIFDADFVPERDFLQRTLPYFADARVGMVQARWGHENRGDSLLTRAEATLLDGHFVIEHKVRNDSGVFFNFNGTAGIWRREAIVTAGGWEHDTLTEDLDLSYRAQLEGWKFVYLPRVVAPAEVPPDIVAFKSQQHRWAKGSVQVFKKLGVRILVSDQPLRVKLEAFSHLSGNAGYPCVLLLAFLLPLSLGLSNTFPHWLHLGLFCVCTLSVVAFYETSQRAIGRPLGARLVDTFAAIALGIGMSVSQTRAVIEGLLPGTGVFVRTPKKGDAQGARRYRVPLLGWPGIELVIAGWFGYGIWVALRNGFWGSLPFLALFLASFAWVGGLSLAEWWQSVRSSRAPSGVPLVEA